MDGNLTFGFWNCAISPPGQSDPVDEMMVGDALKIILSLFVKKELSILFLCEVNNESFSIINSRLSDYGLCAILADEKTSTGARFDLACIYLPDLVEVKKEITHFGRVGTSSIKVAQSFIVRSKEVDEPIEFFLSHWPSRLREISESFRHECSIGLKNNFSKLQDENKYFVLLGDYNDDPYSGTIFTNLRATNDRALVISSPDFWLYNPFWRALFARSYYSKGEVKHDFGTCYSKANNRNSWSTFDQIIFSGNFLTESIWGVNEAKCHVVSDEYLIDMVMCNENKFDHLPVIGSIFKN